MIITEVLPSTRYSIHFLISRLRVPADATYTLAQRYVGLQSDSSEAKLSWY